MKKAVENLPIPTHLRPYLVPTGKNSETTVCGTIRCTCNNETFSVLSSNERRLVRLVCQACGEEILLFDADRHGWDGFVCEDQSLDRTQPLIPLSCGKCLTYGFGVSVRIQSMGRENFENECAEFSDDPHTERTFTPEDWVNAFGWIEVSLLCRRCRKRFRGWLDTETA